MLIILILHNNNTKRIIKLWKKMIHEFIGKLHFLYEINLLIFISIDINLFIFYNFEFHIFEFF